MAARPLFGIISLILLGGALLLQFFVILSGDTYGTPTNRVYYLQTTTNGIASARDPTRWTFFRICGVENGLNANCGATVPALPFDPPHRSNFNTTTGVPEAFVGVRKFFFLSRFEFAFYLISLVFGALALFTGLLALCTRLGAYISAVNTFVACGFQMFAAVLMTVWVVQGRNAFRAAGHEASIGQYQMAFTWTSFILYFLATITFVLGGTLGGRNKRDSTGSGSHFGSKRASGGTFGRKGSTRSRGSFKNEEYS